MENKNVYTVKSLLLQLLIAANNKVWASNPNPLTVQGTVSNIKVVRNKIVYFDINGSGMKIRASTPFEHRPENNENIIFFGTVVLQTTPIYTGLEALIDGIKVGKWKAEYTTAKPILQLERDRGRYSLAELIDSNDNYPIAVVGSKKGGDDLRDRIYNKDINLIFTEIPVGSTKGIISDIKKLLLENDYCAICLVRGGADETMKLWDDSFIVEFLLKTRLPFYSALGHSDSISLTDKFADEAFPTPSVLGESINSELLSKRNKEENQKYQEKQAEEILQLRALLINKDKESKKGSPFLFISIGLLIGVLITALVIIFL